MLKPKNSRGWLICLAAGLLLAVFCLFFLSNSWRMAKARQEDSNGRFALRALNFFQVTDYNELWAFFEEGRPVSAKFMMYYLTAVRFMDTDFSSHYMVGLCYHSQGRINEAEVEYKKTLALRPDFFWAYYNLGLLYWRAGYKDEALRYWAAAITLQPQDTVKAIMSSKLLYDCGGDLSFWGKNLTNTYIEVGEWMMKRDVPSAAKVKLF